jgi:large subunit ribosomal protein L30
VSDKAQRTVRIKWVRSGIGFDYHQKRIVRSLGLKKLNQEVERPDTPQIRGLVAKVPHLVEIVEAVSKPAWTFVPEYTIYPPEAVSSKAAETALEAPAVETALEAPAAETEKAEALVSPPRAPHVSLEDEPEAAATGDVTALPGKSGIERHAEILRSAQNDSAARGQGEAGPAEVAADASRDRAIPNVSQPATPGGEGSASTAEEASPSEGQPKD